MRRYLFLFVALILLAQPACFLKFWGKGPPPGEVKHDIYGTLQDISAEKIVVETKKGVQTFIMGPASIKGGDLRQGDYVHVFYKNKEEGAVVTMVVEKIG